MILKKFNPDELKELIEIFIEVYNSPPWNDQWVKKRAVLYLNAFINEPAFMGYSAYQKGRLIGACFGKIKYWWKEDEYYINEIFIHKSFQNKGLGTSFLSLIQKELEKNNIKTITLLTKKQTPADHFYTANGFTSIEEMTFKYKHF